MPGQMSFGQSPQQHHYTTPMQQQKIFNSSQQQIVPPQNMSFSESYANSSNINQQAFTSRFPNQQSFYDNINGTDEINEFRLHQPNVSYFLNC